MKFTRREFAWMSLGLFAAGCAGTTPRTQTSSVPTPIWPDSSSRPTAHPVASNNYPPPPAPIEYPKSKLAPTQPAQLPNGPTALMAIPRSAWAEAEPIAAKLNPMEGACRITVHHEGWTPVWFNDYASTAVRLEQIRKSHLVRLGAADIGYHYVIDRAGRVWQGRDVKYQGAHVHANNEHNVGVMVLGNFDLQTPTDQQLKTLQTTLTTLMRHYGVSASEKPPTLRDPSSKNEYRYVYTHREINPTECPGTNLQSRLVSMRAKGGSLRAV